jgi:uncharacterized protein YerC
MEVLDTLYTAAGTIRGRDSAKDFMRELLTESERIMLGRRILIARELLFGSTYDEIVEKYKVGKDTILRVAKWLDDQFPGYENTVADVDREFAERKQKADDRYMYATSALYRLKKKYPLHFLLFPLPRKNK